MHPFVDALGVVDSGTKRRMVDFLFVFWIVVLLLLSNMIEPQKQNRSRRRKNKPNEWK
jgi:preprotein translocase subunit SecG